MSEIARYQENDKMSKVVVHNGTIYMSGQVADDPSQDFEGQLTQILAKLDAQFAEFGIDRKHMLSAMVWIDDYKKWGRLNKIWTQWVPAGHKPVRSCVEAKLAFPEYQVEIAVIAAAKSP
ncbi:MAG: RidA family protein [Xanthobacteraceae bacterium]|nr:RidA family protein [Xanthobacteraceae bacterium]